MKWNAISGTWRITSPQVEYDVRSAVADIMKNGEGIVTGGALGVDYIATVEALEHNPTADRIKIYLPSTLDIYAAHYRRRADEGVITFEKAELLIKLLKTIKQRLPGSLIELEYTELNEKTYYLRNTKVVENADTLFAFQVNNSAGVQDTIDKAKALGMDVVLKQYAIRSI